MKYHDKFYSGKGINLLYFCFIIYYQTALVLSYCRNNSCETCCAANLCASQRFCKENDITLNRDNGNYNNDNDDEDSSKFNLWVIFLVIGVSLILIVIVFIRRRQIRRQSAQAAARANGHNGLPGNVYQDDGAQQVLNYNNYPNNNIYNPQAQGIHAYYPGAQIPSNQPFAPPPLYQNQPVQVPQNNQQPQQIYHYPPGAHMQHYR